MVLMQLSINYPILKRALACFSYLLRALQNIILFIANDRLNVMLSAHSTQLWLKDFDFHVSAVWRKLSNLTQLTRLSVSSSTLDDTDCGQLIQLLGNNPTLEDLFYNVY